MQKGQHAIRSLALPVKMKTVMPPPKKPQQCVIFTPIHNMHWSNHETEVLLPLSKYTIQMMLKGFLIIHLMQTSYAYLISLAKAE